MTSLQHNITLEESTMMALKTARLRPMLQRAVQVNSARPMTVLSKQSAEEYKKQVSFRESETLNKQSAGDGTGECCTVVVLQCF